MIPLLIALVGQRKPALPPIIKPKPPIKVPATVGEDQGYVASKQTPAQIALKADVGVAKLSGGEAQTLLIAQMPVGHGESRGVLKVRDRQHVWAQYAITKGLSTLTTTFSVRNGNVISIYGASEKGHLTLPNAGPFAVTSSTSAMDWLVNPARYVMSGLFTNQGAFSAFVQSVQRDKTMSVSAQERIVKVDGVSYSTIRITAKRVKGTPLKVSITFDTQRYLPNTVIAEGVVKGGKAKMIWSGVWKGPMKFADSEFQLH